MVILKHCSDVLGRMICHQLPCLMICLVFFLVLPSQLLLAQTHPATRLLFLGPHRPCILELEMVTGRLSIFDMRRRYAEEVFKQLDQDADGELNAAEAEQIPTQGRLRVGVERLEANWTVLDVSPQDGKISLEELIMHLQESLGPPLTIEKAPPKLAATVRLFDDLDVNGDGMISGEEVHTGLKILGAFDFDDDETLSVAELQPFPLSVVQAQQQVEAKEAPVPVFLIRDEAEFANAIEGLGQYYGAGAGKDVRVPAQMLSGFNEREFSRFDRNNDQFWDSADWELFLKRAPVDFAIKVSLAPPGVTVLKGDHTGNPRPVTNIGGLPVEWVARNNSYQQFDATRLYLTRFLVSDQDKNKYLDPMEFLGLQTEVPFEAVDLDGNQQVTREEIQFFFSMDGMAAQSRLILLLSNETKTLFEILDANLDRRLSPREFLEGAERLLQYDLNKDGALSPQELDSQFRVTFTQPKLFETDPAIAQTGMQTQRQGIVRMETSGPVWFRRMDDNLDGEISWREFLGSREKFDELDQNNDNFIDLREAEAAEEQRNSAAVSQ